MNLFLIQLSVEQLQRVWTVPADRKEISKCNGRAAGCAWVLTLYVSAVFTGTSVLHAQIRTRHILLGTSHISITLRFETERGRATKIFASVWERVA